MNRMVLSYYLSRIVWLLSVSIPTTIAVLWTIQPSIKATAAVLTYSAQHSLAPEHWEFQGGFLEIKRSIQKHFLSWDVYIPLTDIVEGLPPQGIQSENPTLAKLMQKACGPANMYVWIPYTLRIPIVGEYKSQWCWKVPDKASEAKPVE